MVPLRPSAAATVLVASVATWALLAFIPLQSVWQQGTSALSFVLPAASHQAAGPTTNEMVHGLAAAQQQQHHRKLAGAAWQLPANTVAVVAVVTALAFSATRSSRSGRNTGFIQRRAVYNSYKRPGKTVIIPWNGELSYPAQRNFWPGQKGYKEKSTPFQKLPESARLNLSFVDDAMLEFTRTQFTSEPPAKLQFADVKEVGSCSLTYGDDGPSISAPASFPTYVKPGIGYRLEKEEGPKRAPEDDAEYKAHYDKKHTLVETVSKTGLSTNKDIICDRESLACLMRYITGEQSKILHRKGQRKTGVDFVKISKVPGTKTLVFENIFRWMDLIAERRPYQGAWKRSEVSHHGEYRYAWHRLATGDKKTSSYMITGLKQVAGKRAGIPPRQFRFVEYTLGGLSFLTRTQTEATLDGSSVEFKTQNWYYMDKYTKFEAYTNMILGGVDMTAMAIHRSGKITDVVDVKFNDIKSEELETAVECRFGYLVAMIKQIKEAIEKSSDDGPWVLQWQRKKLVLGRYQMPEKEETDEEKEPEVELELA